MTILSFIHSFGKIFLCLVIYHKNSSFTNFANAITLYEKVLLDVIAVPGHLEGSMTQSIHDEDTIFHLDLTRWKI